MTPSEVFEGDNQNSLNFDHHPQNTQAVRETKISYPFVFLFLSIILFVSCNQVKQNPTEVIVTGTISNPTGDSAFIRLFQEVGWEMTTFGGVLNEEGSFSITFQLNEPQPAQFSDGNESSKIFISPGDQINISLDTEEFDETISYAGKGAAENNFMAANYLKFEDPPLQYWKLMDSLNVNQYEKLCSNKKKRQFELLSDYAAQHKLSESFTKYMNTEYDFYYATNIYLYIARKRNPKQHPDTVNIPKNFYSQVGNMITYPDPFIKSQQYKGFFDIVPGYFAAINPVSPKNRNEADSLMMIDITSLLKGNNREDVLSRQFYIRLVSYNIKFFEKYQAVFEEYVTQPSYRNYVLTKYEKTKKELAREIPENAFLKDLNDEAYSDLNFQDIIDQYKGKVLYLDFWASWCGPCRREMPYSLELQEYFKGKDVAFVYISSDSGFEEWERMIRILQITGDHYRVTRTVKKEYNDVFNVRFIPRYVIYDKAGAVVDSAATRPSDAKIRGELEKLL